MLNLVNRQIFVVYELWLRAFPGHCNMMWDRLICCLKGLKHFENASFVPQNYIGQAASILDCDMTQFLLAIAWDIQRLKHDLLIAMKYNTLLPSHKAVERQANE